MMQGAGRFQDGRQGGRCWWSQDPTVTAFRALVHPFCPHARASNRFGLLRSMALERTRQLARANSAVSSLLC